VVRVFNKDTNRLVRSRVTDKQGRFNFILSPGSYYIKVTKPKYNFPSIFLKDKEFDAKYVDLYHGETIQVTEKKISVSVNVPLDPTEDQRTPRKVIFAYYLRKLQKLISFSSIILGFIMIFIIPSGLTIGLFLLQCLLYVLFRRLSYSKKPKSWGVIYDKNSDKPLGRAIARVYDQHYNKLLETIVTDSKGRYTFLVDKNIFYVTGEKKGYDLEKSDAIDLITASKDLIIDKDLGLDKEDESHTPPEKKTENDVSNTQPTEPIDKPAEVKKDEDHHQEEKKDDVSEPEPEEKENETKNQNEDHNLEEDNKKDNNFREGHIFSMSKKEEENIMEKLVSLAKRRGFIFPSSEIYGGLSSSYDYGPLGVELKNNIKKAWWDEMVLHNENIYGLDAAILMHPKVWEASGHVENFTDPLVDCKKCKKRFRADHLLEAKGIKPDLGTMKDRPKELRECPECSGELTETREFNLMFKTFMGPVEDEASIAYLRPETAQGIYVNFHNVKDSMRVKVPFGIAQIGKAFRNEITPGNFTFRTREFEQMEMQYFVHPKDADRIYKEWKEKRLQWYINLGLDKKKLRFRDHKEDELAHYAKAAVDIEYETPFGWKELEGVHHRGDWDLSRHSKYSGDDLSYTDLETKEKFLPYVVETSAGADRTVLIMLIDAYTEVTGGRTTTTKSSKEVETMLKFDKRIAPLKIAILPLVKKEPLIKVAKKLHQDLKVKWTTAYDEVASIGRRYRRQDEIGTPYCLTVDFDSIEKDNSVTIRDRDTMKQERIKIEELTDYFEEKFK